MAILSLKDLNKVLSDQLIGYRVNVSTLNEITFSMSISVERLVFRESDTSGRSILILSNSKADLFLEFSVIEVELIASNGWIIISDAVSAYKLRPFARLLED